MLDTPWAKGVVSTDTDFGSDEATGVSTLVFATMLGAVFTTKPFGAATSAVFAGALVSVLLAM
jgi:hypothetical protein